MPSKSTAARAAAEQRTGLLAEKTAQTGGRVTAFPALGKPLAKAVCTKSLGRVFQFQGLSRRNFAGMP